MKLSSHRTLAARLAAAAVLAALAGNASADHAWGAYHWARTSNPFTIKLGDNVSGVWDNHLSLASSDWTNSAVLDTTVVAGSSNPKNCRLDRRPR